MYIKPTIGGSTRRHFNSLVKFDRKAKKNASKVSPKFEGFLSNIYVKNPSRNILTWIEFSNEETIPGNNATFDLWYKASRHKETLTMGLHKLVYKEYWISTRMRSINVKNLSFIQMQCAISQRTWDSAKYPHSSCTGCETLEMAQSPSNSVI